MEKWKKRSVDLIAGLALLGKVDPSVVPFAPQKTKTSTQEKKYFVRSTPEKHGISSKRLYNMLSELELDRRVNLHNLIVIKGGEVICECSHPGYDTSVWHLSHSMTKTVTGMAIGMLVDDGNLKVTDRVADLFPDYDYKDRRFGDMTVEHLLCMSSGVPFAELGSVTESEWTYAFFGSSLKYAPGADFSYNSMNTYILARIVNRITGLSLEDFLRDRLFRPLGIYNYHWEIGPEGIEKGGWGLYMSPESWAKLGYMMLNLGSFEGQRILSAEWVRASCSRHNQTPETLGDFDYGYQMWVGRGDDEFLFNGMLGQNVWVYPEGDLIVVANAGNNEMFQKSATISVIRKYLHCEINDTLHRRDYFTLKYRERHFFESRHWIRFAKPKRDILSLLGIREREPYIDEWNNILGTYVFRRNNVGQLPVFVRTMQNNFNCSIDSISFEREGNGVVMTVTESGRGYRIPVGLYGFFSESVFDFSGERYMVKAAGEAMEDENRRLVFKIELLFPELPNTRMIRIYRTDEGHALFKFSEMPNERIVMDLVDGATVKNPRMGLLFRAMDSILKEKNYFSNRLDEVFSPAVMGYEISREGYEDLLAQENEEYDRKIRDNASKVSFISKFISMDDTDRDEDTSAEESESDGVREEKKGSILSLFPFFKRQRAEAEEVHCESNDSELSADNAEESSPVSEESIVEERDEPDEKISEAEE